MSRLVAVHFKRSAKLCGPHHDKYTASGSTLQPVELRVEPLIRPTRSLPSGFHNARNMIRQAMHTSRIVIESAFFLPSETRSRVSTCSSPRRRHHQRHNAMTVSLSTITRHPPPYTARKYIALPQCVSASPKLKFLSALMLQVNFRRLSQTKTMVLIHLGHPSSLGPFESKHQLLDSWE